MGMFISSIFDQKYLFFWKFDKKTKFNVEAEI